MSVSVIEVNDLSKRYEDFYAVDGVSFSVRKNEIFSLVGPNGAGKTTTVEILECLREPSSGMVRVLGNDVTEDEVLIKESIGVLPQDFSTFDKLSVRENVGLMRDVYGDGLGVDEVLESMGLVEFDSTRFQNLSGGLKRKTGIAMALVSDPDILFLDEPTTGLDPRARRETWERIRELKEMGKTIFLTSHYMDEVKELSDRAAVMIDGEIEALDSIDSLIGDYGGEVKIVAGSSDDEVREILEDGGDEVYLDDQNLVGLYNSRENAQESIMRLYGLEGDFEIKLVEPGMEDVFFELVGGKIDSEGDLNE